LFFFHAKAARIVMASSAAAAAAASASTAVAIASTPSDVLAATSDEPGVKGAIRIINVPNAQAPDASCAPYGPPNRKMAFALRGIEDPSGKHIVVLAHLTATAESIIAAIAANISWRYRGSIPIRCCRRIS